MDYKEAAVQLVLNKYEVIKSERKSNLEKLRKDLTEDKKKPVFFGAGLLGKSIYALFQNEGIQADTFCDNNEELWGQVITDGKICISPAELEKMDNIVIFITLGKAYEVLQQLNLMHLKTAEIYQYPLLSFEKMHNNHFDYSKEEISDRLKIMFDLLEDETSREAAYWQVKGWFADQMQLNSIFFKEIMVGDEYVPKDIFAEMHEKVIVDCGTYNGDTYRYLKSKGVKWQKYVGFEMDLNNYNEFLTQVTDEKEQAILKLYHAGVGQEEKTVRYFSGLAGTKISKEGMESSSIVTIDKVIGDSDEVSYLKMDIEGAEMPALKGGKKTIKRCRPKCAICAYHQPSDLWEIPVYLKKLVPEYKIFFRHHDYIHSDIICYATVPAD